MAPKDLKRTLRFGHDALEEGGTGTVDAQGLLDDSVEIRELLQNGDIGNSLPVGHRAIELSMQLSRDIRTAAEFPKGKGERGGCGVDSGDADE